MNRDFDFTDYTRILYMTGTITKKQYADVNYQCKARRNQLDKIEAAHMRDLDKVLDEERG